MSPDDTEMAATGDVSAGDAATGDVANDDVSAGDAATGGDTPAPERGRRKVREGLVTSTKMQATAVVSVTERVRHPRYAKTVQRTKKLYVHDADNDARVGDRVRVMETRPLSRTKRWRLLEIVERAR